MNIPKREYAAEFKELAVKRVKEGVTPGTAVKELGLVEQTLCSWVKAAAAGKLNGAGTKVVTPEQMELSRLRAQRTIWLKRKNSIHAHHKLRYKVQTDSKHSLPVAANLLDRNFTPPAPDQVWTSDITCLWTNKGWLYLAIVFDLFNREVMLGKTVKQDVKRGTALGWDML